MLFNAILNIILSWSIATRDGSLTVINQSEPGSNDPERVTFLSRELQNWILTNGYSLAYLPSPPLGQDMTQGQFLSGV